MFHSMFAAKYSTLSKKDNTSSSESSSSRISSKDMNMILESLKMNKVRKSTSCNYMSIWRNFNKFLVKLDHMPKLWEDRASLFCAYLIDKGNQSQTIKSYISAIKSVLVDDGYEWNDDRILLNSLTRACRLQNDKLKCRLPITQKLLDILIFELKRVIKSFHLQVLYRALFCLAYYGLMRIGELTESPHVVKACNVHVGTNKDKIMLVLYSSKTHGIHMNPQKIKISALSSRKVSKDQALICPFDSVRDYLSVRGEYISDMENFFIQSDGMPITSGQVRAVLKLCLESVNLNP